VSGRAQRPGAGYGRLLRRAEFLRLQHAGRKHVAPGVVVQAAPREAEAASPPRAGFTATRKIGGAVTRNRARRRLKEAVRLSAEQMLVGMDYVFIARNTTAGRDFAALLNDVRAALSAVQRQRKAASAP
jgi:ribonuclease P protein component